MCGGYATGRRPPELLRLRCGATSAASEPDRHVQQPRCERCPAPGGWLSAAVASLAEEGTDTECMTVGVAEVKLTDAPGLIGWRHRHIEAKLDCPYVHPINLIERVEEPRHPYAAGALIERMLGWAHSPRALPIATEEDLGSSASRTGEARFI